MSRMLKRGLWFVACIAFAQFASAADWPKFLGPNGNNISAETNLVDRWTEKGPAIVWDKAIGSGYSAPSVQGDVLVLHHRLGDEEIIEAMDATNGKSKWQYKYASGFTDPFGYNNGPRGSPLLTSNRCYTLG